MIKNKVPRKVKIKLTKKQAKLLEDTLITIVKQHFKGWEIVALGADFKSIVALRDSGEVMAYAETISNTNELTQVASVSISDIVAQIDKAI